MADTTYYSTQTEVLYSDDTGFAAQKISVCDWGITGGTDNFGYTIGSRATKLLTDAADVEHEFLNKGLNESISYCGVDSNCPWITSTWILGMSASGNPDPTSDTNISVSIPTGTASIGLSAMNQNPSFGVTGDMPAFYTHSYITFKGDRVTDTSWSSAAWGDDITHRFETAQTIHYLNAFNANIIPVTKFAMKDYVWVPVIKAAHDTSADWTATDYGTLPLDVDFFDLYTYCNGSDTFSGQTETYFAHYPIILGIYLVPYSTQYDAETTHPNRVTEGRGLAPFYPAGTVHNRTYTIGSGSAEQTRDIKLRVLSSNPNILASITVKGSTLTNFQNNVETVTYGSFDARPILLNGMIGVAPATTVISSTDPRNEYGIVGSKFTYKIYSGSSSNFSNGIKNRICAYANQSEFGSTPETFREAIRKQVAYLGMFFRDHMRDTTSTAALDTPRTFLGIIDASGITHGEYSEGPDNKNQRQYDWTDPTSQTPYKPGGGGTHPDPNAYLSTAPTPRSRSIVHFGQYYAGDSNDISYVNAFVNKVKDSENFETLDELELWLQRNFLTSNPIDNIIGLKWYPFDTADFIGASTQSTVKLGKAYVNVYGGYASSTNALQMYSTTSPVTMNTLYLGHFEPLTAYGDFRDYSPYSEAQLYLPYCGTTTFPLSFALSEDRTVLNSIYVQYKIDITTGACTAWVTIGSYDGLPIVTAHGTIGIDIPVSGAQQASYQNALYNGIQNLRQIQLSQKQNQFANGSRILEGAVGFKNSFTAKGGNPVKAGWELAKTLQESYYQNEGNKLALSRAQYDIQTTPIEKTTIGNCSAGDGCILYEKPMLFITRPVNLSTGWKDLLYSNTTGNATCETDYLSHFSNNIIKCSDVRIESAGGNDITPNEIEEITAALTSGLYINTQ